MQFDPTITTDGLIYGIAILILIGVTIYYAIQNRRMADELKRQNENAVKPYLVITDASMGTGLVQLIQRGVSYIKPEMLICIINGGNGTALDIGIEASAEIEFVDEVRGDSSIWLYKFALRVPPSQKKCLFSKEEPIQYRLEYVKCEQAEPGNVKGLVVNLSCVDILGNKVTDEQHFEDWKHSVTRKEGVLWPHDDGWTRA